jgi:single-strand DNA-binding protein
MASLNRVSIIGYLGGDPDVRDVAGGLVVATVSIATTEAWKDRQTGARKEHTEWHRVVFFNKLAERAEEYLKKGAQVFVEGKLRTTKWTGTDQVERYTTEIIASEFKMLGKRDSGSNGGYQAAQSATPDSFSNADEGGSGITVEYHDSIPEEYASAFAKGE